jgi:hypothetical protein
VPHRLGRPLRSVLAGTAGTAAYVTAVAVVDDGLRR